MLKIEASEFAQLTPYGLNNADWLMSNKDECATFFEDLSQSAGRLSSSTAPKCIKSTGIFALNPWGA